jgi:hypothetical protein
MKEAREEINGEGEEKWPSSSAPIDSLASFMDILLLDWDQCFFPLLLEMEEKLYWAAQGERRTVADRKTSVVFGTFY